MLAGVLATLTAILGPLLSPKIPPPVPQRPEPATIPSPAPYRPVEPRDPPPRVIPPDIRSLPSSAYCQRGRTASGLPVGPGIAASNVLYGRRVMVIDGPLAGEVYDVRDRHSTRYRELLDFWTADCGRARLYGRRTVTVAVD